jgi:hypothetical protein
MREHIIPRVNATGWLKLMVWEELKDKSKIYYSRVPQVSCIPLPPCHLLYKMKKNFYVTKTSHLKSGKRCLEKNINF